MCGAADWGLGILCIHARGTCSMCMSDIKVRTKALPAPPMWKIRRALGLVMLKGLPRVQNACKHTTAKERDRQKYKDGERGSKRGGEMNIHIQTYPDQLRSSKHDTTVLTGHCYYTYGHRYFVWGLGFESLQARWLVTSSQSPRLRAQKHQGLKQNFNTGPSGILHCQVLPSQSRSIWLSDND